MKPTQKSPSILSTVIWTINLIFSFNPILVLSLIVLQIITSVFPFFERKSFSTMIDSFISAVSNHTTVWQKTFLIYFIFRLVNIFFSNLSRTIYRIFDLNLRHSLRVFFCQPYSYARLPAVGRPKNLSLS